MIFIVKRNVLVTIAIVFIGSVHSVLSDFNSTAVISVANDTASVSDVTHPQILSRRKRYVAFPEGSSFSVNNANFIIEILTVSVFRWHFARHSAWLAIPKQITWVGHWIGASHTISRIRRGLSSIGIRKWRRNQLLNDDIAAIYTVAWRPPLISE